MSLTRDHNDIVFQCDADGCRESLETGTSNFEAARNLLRRAGWKPTKRNGNVQDNRGAKGEWSHTCPGCQRDLFKGKSEGRAAP